MAFASQTDVGSWSRIRTALAIAHGPRLTDVSLRPSRSSKPCTVVWDNAAHRGHQEHLNKTSSVAIGAVRSRVVQRSAMVDSRQSSGNGARHSRARVNAYGLE